MPDVSDRKNRLRLLLLGLFLVALLPRLSAINRYVTPDELAWVFRSIRFREALLDHRWADTLVSGHPGVCTTWLGALGISVQLLLRPADGTVYEWITHLAWLAPENTVALSQLGAFLTAGRLMAASVNSLGIVVLYALLRPMVGRQVALCASLLLALDPFMAGLSGLLHVDSLTATLVTLSLAAFCNGVIWRNKLSYSAAAGALAAAAVLTKSLALLLGPFTALLLLIWFLYRGRKDHFSQVLAQGFTWLGAFALTFFLILPAFWVSPSRVFDTILGAAAQYSEGALHSVFFLGEYTHNPGPLYYPLALAFRSSPIVFLGVFLFVYLLCSRRFSQPRLFFALSFLLWSMLLAFALTIAAQKFDRYLLPAIPALVIVAVLAWDEFARLSRLQALVVWLPLFQLAWLLLAVPYPLTTFNPVLGGSSSAERVLNIGWGEGISAGAQWLAQQPGAAETKVTASTMPAVAPFYPGSSLPWSEQNLAQADYLILSVLDRQTGPLDFPKMAAMGDLIHTVRFNGRDQAWVYALPQPRSAGLSVSDFTSPFSFDHRVQLKGVNTAVKGGRIQLLVRWGLWRPGRYTVKVELADEVGHVWGELETVLLNEVFFYPEHWPSNETPEVAYTIQLPVGIPPADYQLKLSLFDAHTVTRLSLLAADGAFRGVAYRHPVTINPSPELPTLASLDVPHPKDVAWSNGALKLLGHGSLPATVLAGDRMTIDLFWQSQSSLPDDLGLSIGLGGSDWPAAALSRYSTGQWRTGELIHEKYQLEVPVDFPPGRYPLQVVPVTLDRVRLDGEHIMLGWIEIVDSERLFELPSDISTLLDIQFGQYLRLRGTKLPTLTYEPGDVIQVTLYWQADSQPDQAYTAFVHLLAPDQAIVAQADRWPGGSPSDTWAAGQVMVDDYAIPIPEQAPAGTYQLAIGLYNAADGVRLPSFAPDESSMPDDRFVLPQTIAVVVHD